MAPCAPSSSPPRRNRKSTPVCVLASSGSIHIAQDVPEAKVVRESQSRFGAPASLPIVVYRLRAILRIRGW